MWKRTFIGTLLVIAVVAASIPAQSNTEALDRDAALRALTDQLREHTWAGIQLIGMSPANWAVHLTRPMKEILKYGSGAQSILLERLSEPRIKDQVIFLLGGVGDERAVGPIIDTMIDSREANDISNATEINFCASFALTNITAAEVVWPHSGGNLILQCPLRESQRCWQEWWSKHRATFKAAAVSLEERDQPFYPSYGIYRVSDHTGLYDDEDLRRAVIGPNENK
jgi:hypothetical protein